MDILLLQPPISDFYQTKIRLQPLGLAYLKAVAQRYHPGINVNIRDLQTGYKKKTIPLPKSLKYLQEYYREHDDTPFSTFHQFYYFGAQESEIINIITEKKWDLIGVSSLFSPYYSDVLELINLIKKHAHQSKIVIGGGHPSATAKELLKNNQIDYIIRGEGERPFIELIDHLKNNKVIEDVSNLSYRNVNGRICENPTTNNFPLDDLPIPDLPQLGITKYLFEKKPLAFLMSSRGCPHQCHFCSSFQVFGRKYRVRSNESILQEIDQRVHEGYQAIDFEDDNLAFNYKKSLELFNEIAKRQYKIELMAMNGISYHGLDYTLLQSMKNAGFKSLNISLVSDDNTLIKAQKRPHKNETFMKVTKIAFGLGFKVTGYIILGLPNSSVDSMIHSIVFLANLPLLIGASTFYLVPGTPIEDQFPDDIDYKDYRKCRLTAFAYQLGDFDRDDIFTLFVTCRIINFIKSFNPTSQCDINELLNLSYQDPKTNKAISRLKDLLINNVWYHNKFKTNLFKKIWKQMPYVTTQDGSTISTS